MNKLYEELKQKLNEYTYKAGEYSIGFDDFSHFVSMRGSNYLEQDVRLLIVGRATNGWFSIDSNEEFGKIANEKFTNSGKYEEVQFKWLVNENDGLRNKTNEFGEIYKLSSSPFWRTSKRIWGKLSGNEEDETDRWVDYIAWSNLYKIAAPDPLQICKRITKTESPSKELYEKFKKLNMNPTSKMGELQRETCIKILQKEIEVYKPTHILFITGWDWVEPFKNIMDQIEEKNPKNICRTTSKKQKNEVYVEGVGKIGNTKVIVACRPEGRDETKYVKQIINVFNNL